MELQHVKSSGVLVESDGIEVLCDPWLKDGAYYGSWAHYPPLEVEPEDYNHVDYIYISHIHPDHFHEDTLAEMDTDIPVLVHDYETNFLKYNIERLGFDVRELPHNERIHLDGDLHINVLGADNCDPEVCGSYFACGWWMNDADRERTSGSTQIDSMGVFDDGENVIVNVNDCRWPLSRQAGYEVKEQYGDIDLLLMQYSAANFYPQCMGDYTPEEKKKAAAEVKAEMFRDAEGFINLFEPDYYMPFAGSYTLSGSLAELNEYLAVPKRIEAYEHFSTSDDVEPSHSECILLNHLDWFDLDAETASSEYRPIDEEDRRRYIDEVLSERELEYESDPMPTIADFHKLIPKAYDHLEEKRSQVGFSTETVVLLRLLDDEFVKITFDRNGYEYLTDPDVDEFDKYVKMEMSPRLLKRILRGPKHAHFDNAHIGSHVRFEKEPDIYERALYYCMSFFHA